MEEKVFLTTCRVLSEEIERLKDDAKYWQRKYYELDEKVQKYMEEKENGTAKED